MAKSGKRTYLHIIVAIVIFAILKLAIPTANGLTSVGVNVIAVFVPILYLWLTVSTDWVSWVALGLLIMTGIMNPATIYAGTFGTPLIITVIAMMAFSKVLTDTGVIGTLVKWMMTREIVRNRPYVFIAMMLVACAVVSMFVDVGAVSLIFLSMISVVCTQIGYKKGDPFYTALCLGVFWVSNAFNGGSPLGHALPVIMMNSAAASGNEISYAQWMSVGVPFAIIATVVCIFIICVLWRPEASKFRNYDLDAARKEVQPLTRQGIISLVIFLAVIAYWVLPEVVPSLFPAAALSLIKTWGTTLPLMFALALLCVIHVGGKPITTFRELTSTSTVTVLLFIGAVTILGNAVSSADSGISVCLGNILSPITSHMSPFVLVLVVATYDYCAHQFHLQHGLYAPFLQPVGAYYALHGRACPGTDRDHRRDGVLCLAGTLCGRHRPLLLWARAYHSKKLLQVEYRGHRASLGRCGLRDLSLEQSDSGLSQPAIQQRRGRETGFPVSLPGGTCPVRRYQHVSI